MKKTPFILLTLILSIALAACGASPAASSPTSAEAPQDAVVTFTDPMLEELVRGTLGLPEGDIPLAQAQAVTRLDLGNHYRDYFQLETPITDLAGLEAFTGLESLDLSGQAVMDLSPLAGLTRLTTLALGGNPVADVSPLAGLTSLKLLVLSGSQAPDYGALANLINLQVLMLDNSTITDLSPLAALVNLRHLHLAKCVIDDYAPLESLYPNLETRDFTIASTLMELGFYKDDGNHQASYENEDASFTIHHNAWGPPQEEWLANSVRLSLDLRDGYVLKAVFYPDLDVYGFGMGREGEKLMDYVYDVPSGDFTFREGDRASSEQAVRAAMDIEDGEDVLTAPVRLFNDTVRNTFGMSVKAIFAMPFEPPSLRSLGFYADQANAVYLYEYRSGNMLDDVNMEVHRPEWGEKEFDVRFFTPLSEEYRVVITWHAAERKFAVSADDNNQGGARFYYFIDTGESLDEWCSDPNLTVEEYFKKAFNDPAVTDIYQHSVDLMANYISDIFGMTIEELYALPTGE